MEKNHIHVVKEITDDDGNVTLNLHVFSPETLEWRAAEYGVDIDEAIDIILFEPFVDAPQVYQDEHTNFDATRKVFKDAIKAAKEKLAPVVIVKEASAKVTSKPDNVRNFIKQASFFDEETLDLKRQHVEATLELKRTLMEQVTEQPSRADSLRSNLSKISNK